MEQFDSSVEESSKVDAGSDWCLLGLIRLIAAPTLSVTSEVISH